MLRLKLALAIVVGLVLGQVAVSWPVVCTPFGTLTTNLGLCKPADGEVNWGPGYRASLDLIDGFFTSASLLKPANGGTGLNTSASTGLPSINAGVFAVNTVTENGTFRGGAGGAPVSTAAMTNGQVLIGSTGAPPVLGTLTGTANRLTVTNGGGTITLTTPQDTHTAATPQFSSLGLNTAAPAAGNLSLTGSIGSYNGNTGANAGAPYQVAAANLTGQTAAIGSTTLFTPAASGLYRATYYIVVTTTGTSVNLVLNLLSTDDAAARTQAAATVSCAATNFTSGVFTIRSTAAAIQYNTTMTGTCTYAVFVALERLS
jgi:hypothetical protein